MHVDSADEVEAELPFAVVIPRYLPADLRIEVFLAILPAEELDRETQRSRTRALLHFRDVGAAEPAMSIVMEQALGPPLPLRGFDDLEAVRIGPVAGELTRVRSELGTRVHLVWPACDLAFQITALLNPATTEDELIRIAESTLDACPEA